MFNELCGTVFAAMLQAPQPGALVHGLQQHDKAVQTDAPLEDLLMSQMHHRNGSYCNSCAPTSCATNQLSTQQQVALRETAWSAPLYNPDGQCPTVVLVLTRCLADANF